MQRAAAPSAFHVVAPSLPGFGYSDRPTTPGWAAGRIAATWVELMRRLGYGRFLAHGGDWGGVVTTVLGGHFPEHVLGIHTTPAQAPPGLSTDGLTDTEHAWVDETRAFWGSSRADCAKQQAAAPQTIGYSLVESRRRQRGRARPRRRRAVGNHRTPRGHREVPPAMGTGTLPRDRAVAGARRRRALSVSRGARAVCPRSTSRPHGCARCTSVNAPGIILDAATGTASESLRWSAPRSEQNTTAAPVVDPGQEAATGPATTR